MNTKNRLSPVIFELLVVRKITKFTIVNARDLLLDKFKDRFTSEKLFKHIHRQSYRLAEYGLLKKSLQNKEDFVGFEVTSEFNIDNFSLGKTTKINVGIPRKPKSQVTKESLPYLSGGLVLKTQEIDAQITKFQQKKEEIDIEINELRQTKADIELILSSGSDQSGQINKFLEGNLELIIEFFLDEIKSKRSKEEK